MYNPRAPLAAYKFSAVLTEETVVLMFDPIMIMPVFLLLPVLPGLLPLLLLHILILLLHIVVQHGRVHPNRQNQLLRIGHRLHKSLPNAVMVSEVLPNADAYLPVLPLVLLLLAALLAVGVENGESQGSA